MLAELKLQSGQKQRTSTSTVTFDQKLEDEEKVESHVVDIHDEKEDSKEELVNSENLVSNKSYPEVRDLQGS